MKRKQVWQYWCDHCGKHNLSAASIAQHEKHCTANPNRSCRMCAAMGLQQKTLSDLVSCIDTSKEHEGLDDLRAAANSCPACMLAAIRQSGANWPGYALQANYPLMCIPNADSLPAFDFKLECQPWRDTLDKRRCEYCGRLECGH